MKKSFWIVCLVWIGLVFVSVCIGRYHLSAESIVKILTGQDVAVMDSSILLQIRLPRTVLVAFSGGALSIAGMVYQKIFSNPIAAPDVLGVSSGCSVGAVFAILYGGGSLLLMQWTAFAMGLLVVILVILMTKVIGGQSLYNMILSGIVLGALMNAVLMFLKYVADPNRELPAIEYWLMGSFSNASWTDILVVSILILIGTSVLYMLRWKIKILTLGDEEARSLGISAGKVRAASLGLATLLVSSVVSVAGIVSWIGLIAPHITKMLSADDLTDHFFMTFLVGSSLLLLADILARSLFTAEIPISILTSFFGAIILFIFLFNRYKSSKA